MATFTTHTIESAPEGAKETLRKAQKNLGFVPNLYANLAGSPTALEAYTTLANIFEKSSLSPTEQQVVALSASAFNGCEFCMAAHSVIAKKMLRVDPAVVNAIREGQDIADSKLQALAKFTQVVVSERGWVSGQAIDDFLAAGFTQEQALDVIVGVGLKTLSNYTNHLTGTTTNKEFASEAWQRR